MTADLIILGAGIAGLSAALGACDGGVFPLLFDAGPPPVTGRRHDLLVDRDFLPVGGPLPTSLAWACTRILGLTAAEGSHHRLPGHVVDREALRQCLLAEALGRGATVAWNSPAEWQDHRAVAGGTALPDVPVLLASRAFAPPDAHGERRIHRVWQGTGTPASSYLVTPVPTSGGQFLLAMVGGNRWSCFGWQRSDDVVPPLPTGAEATWSGSGLATGGDGTLCGPNWLRLGGAAGLEPRHGFGLAARLALSRSAGRLAAAWILDGAGPETWASYTTWLAPFRHWLQTTPVDLA